MGLLLLQKITLKQVLTPGWCEDNVPAIFRPLLHSPQVALVEEVDELDLSDIDGLDPQIAEHIQGEGQGQSDPE